MDFSGRQHIKHLYASKPSKRYGTIDLAVLTDDNTYIEYVLEFRLKALSKYVARKIRSLFQPYIIDKNTDIAVSESLTEDHPLYVYFMLLRQHIGFKLSAISTERIVSRIHYHYTRKAATKHAFNKVWKLVIDKRECPWITQQVEYAIQNKGPSTAKRLRNMRLAMFYIVIKNYMYRIVKKSRKNSMRVKFEYKEKEGNKK